MVFVPGAAPQERIRARVTHKKSRFWEAELVEILEPSPFRRQAPCPVADRCGGCSWQHITYEQQLVQKEKILRDSLRGLAKLGDFEWRPLVAAPSEFFYRNRIQVHQRHGRFGFFAKGTNDLVQVQKCWISEDALNEKLRSLQPSDLRKIEIAATEGGGVVLMEGERDPEAALFSQVNRTQNERLKKMVTALVDKPVDWIMDLYCGSGNLTVPLAEDNPEVTLMAVELSRKAIERAEATHKRFTNIQWRAGDVANVLRKRGAAAGRGVIVTDPPRVGMAAEVVEAIVRQEPAQVIYVSCNPSTFARDAEKLVKSGKLKLVSVQGLDMFPQTEHVELVASFRRP